MCAQFEFNSIQLNLNHIEFKFKWKEMGCKMVHWKSIGDYVVGKKNFENTFSILIIWELVFKKLIWNCHWKGWIFLQIQLFYLYIYLGSTHYQWLSINGKNELILWKVSSIWIHIQWHCMQLKLNWIYILKINSNTLNGIQMWLNLNFIIEKKGCKLVQKVLKIYIWL
jgi:hypothetical protein